MSGPIIRPYGDTTGDGMVQLSFTLPMPHSKIAEGAAAQLANKMGMDPALVVHAKPMGPDFTFFVVYGRVHHLVDPSKVEVVERDYPLLTPKEVNATVKSTLRRRLVVVGGCIGTDAHTVGIDAILNIRRFRLLRGLGLVRAGVLAAGSGCARHGVVPPSAGTCSSVGGGSGRAVGERWTRGCVGAAS